MRIGRLILVAYAACGLTPAQVVFDQQGYVEYRGLGFPQTTYNDRANFIGEALIHYDVRFKFAPGLELIGGTETRTDTHRQAERKFRLNWNDRGLKRPNFSIGRLSLRYRRKFFTIEAGKQIIHWGASELLNPTDRFAPSDFLAVVDTEPLAVSSVRVALKGATDTLEVVVQPLFTPSRIPLLNQRWTMLPEQLRNVPVNDQGSRFPGGSQWGARWNRFTPEYEFSLSSYNGRNHLPLFETSVENQQLNLRRYFARMTMYGADFAIPLRWFRLRGEAAYFSSSTDTADEYVLYVVELEHAAGPWSVVGGYAGQAVTRDRGTFQFAPDRGLTRAFLGRVIYHFDMNRAMTLEAALRQNGDGLLLKSEYSQDWGRHWRGVIGLTLLRGEPTDFLGQYRRNSYVSLALQYRF